MNRLIKQPDNPYLTQRCKDGTFNHKITASESGLQYCKTCGLTDTPLPGAPPRTIPTPPDLTKDKRPVPKLPPRPTTGSKKALINTRDGFNGCRYCGTISGLTLEHLTPRVGGGSKHSIHNLGISCGSCNSLKGRLTEPEFIAWVFTAALPAHLHADTKKSYRAQEAKRITMQAGFLALLDYLAGQGVALHRELVLPVFEEEAV